jgi:uncharacterized protein
VDNTIVGIASFLEAWDRVPEHPHRLRVKHGLQGHRNLLGTNSAPAVVFTRWHPQFKESLETGVADLVVLMIQRLDCVTYSSCEGHASEDYARLLSGRSVDVLPRDAEEQQRLRNDLRSRVGRVRRASNAVSLQLAEGWLETDLGPMPCLDLRFVPTTHIPSAYFAAVEEVYADLLADLASG